MLRRFEDAKANDAIEGIFLTDEEEALFLRMIAEGLDADQRKAQIDAFIAGQLEAPALIAAE